MQEKLPVQVPVQLFHKTLVWKAAVVLQENKGQFVLGGEDGPRAFFVPPSLKADNGST